MITTEDVLKVAKLAKLSFTEPEVDALTSELNSVLGYIDQLNELDVKNVAPLENINESVEKNLLRTDTRQPSLTREEALKNAPRSADGYFLVPKVLEQDRAPKTATSTTAEPDQDLEEDLF